MASQLRPKIFISYKRNHAPSDDIIQKLEPFLIERGFDVLRDVDIVPGKPWSNELYTWLLECGGAVTLIGEEPSKSEWCRREWWFLRERNHASGLPIVPISVDGTWETGGILDRFQGAQMPPDLSGDWSALHALDVAKPSPDDYLAAHHAWLRHQFADAPLWGREPMSLDDIYIDTECGHLPWKDINKQDGGRDPFEDTAECGGRRPLLPHVMELIKDTSLNEPIVVQGPPGSGKSAFTLRLANELLDDGFKPILVRFRDLRFATFQNADELIDDAIRIGPTNEEPVRGEHPIVTEERLSKRAAEPNTEMAETVLIMDGWDEVSLTGNTSYQAQLTTWLPKIREAFIRRRGVKLRLVMTGRPSSEVRASGVLKPDTPILTVRHLVPDALEQFAQDIERGLNSGPHQRAEDAWTLDYQGLAPVFETYRDMVRGAEQRQKTGRSDGRSGQPIVGLSGLPHIGRMEGRRSLKPRPRTYRALQGPDRHHSRACRQGCRRRL